MANRKLGIECSTFTRLMKSFPFGVIILDSKLAITSLNPAAGKVLGLKMEKTLRRGVEPPLDRLFGSRIGRQIHEKLKATLKSRKSFSMDVRLAKAPGDQRFLALNAAPIKSAPEIAGGILLLAEDVTEKKRSDLTNRERLGTFEVVIETAPCLIVILDPEGRIILFNHACEELTGYRREEVIGKKTAELFLPPEWVPIVQERFANLSSPAARDVHENPWITKSGERRLIEWRCILLPAFEGARPLFLGSGTDVTGRKKAEERIQQIQTELSNVCRFSTADEMAAGLAHELNQPLSAIMAFAVGSIKTLQSRGGENKDLLKALEQIKKQAELAGGIIHRLRNFVRPRQSRRSTVNINELLKEVAVLFQSEAHLNDVKITLELAGGLPLVEADSIQIQQVIMNLVRNAVEAMKEIPTEERLVIVRTGRGEKNGVEVAVEDRGKGISDEALSRFFEPFFTTKPDGLGLGLSLAKRIIESHGGRLWVMSNDSRGAVFKFTIPGLERKATP